MLSKIVQTANSRVDTAHHSSQGSQKNVGHVHPTRLHRLERRRPRRPVSWERRLMAGETWIALRKLRSIQATSA